MSSDNDVWAGRQLGRSMRNIANVMRDMSIDRFIELLKEKRVEFEGFLVEV